MSSLRKATIAESACRFNYVEIRSISTQRRYISELPSGVESGEDSTMCHRPSPVLFLSLLFVGFGATVFAEPSETAKRLAQAEADLKNARESLHVAHQELGEKTETINRLERALEKAPGARRKKAGSAEEVALLKRELQAAKATIKRLEEKIELDAAAAGKRANAAKVAAEAEKVKKGPVPKAPEIFRVSYDLNSAASLEGREKALKWIQEKIRERPGGGFEIQGYANDTEYEEANRSIAGNRAKFLASFLRVSGIPADSIVKVSGQVSGETGAAGRIVEVIRAPQAE